MKLLLTSAGVKNASIRDALVGLLGKPIADSSALCLSTALCGHPQGSPGGAWRFIAGQSGCPTCDWDVLRQRDKAHGICAATSMIAMRLTL